mmetsp:Transcript_29432/g.68423  ORF Transcript_29432/g.68423 Transcript_29432/m.68423 type:complete len:224 (-) Transcript_29432:256-927(-)
MMPMNTAHTFAAVELPGWSRIMCNLARMVSGTTTSRGSFAAFAFSLAPVMGSGAGCPPQQPTRRGRLSASARPITRLGKSARVLSVKVMPESMSLALEVANSAYLGVGGNWVSGMVTGKSVNGNCSTLRCGTPSPPKDFMHHSSSSASLSIMEVASINALALNSALLVVSLCPSPQRPERMHQKSSCFLTKRCIITMKVGLSILSTWRQRPRRPSTSSWVRPA